MPIIIKVGSQGSTLKFVGSENDTYDVKNQEYEKWCGRQFQNRVGKSGSGLTSCMAIG